MKYYWAIPIVRFSSYLPRGNGYKPTTKVTDLLISLASMPKYQVNPTKELNAVLVRYEEILSELSVISVMDDIRDNLTSHYRQIQIHLINLWRTLLPAGEDNCARLVAAYLNSIHHPQSIVTPRNAGFVLTSDFGRSTHLPESYRNLSSLSQVEGICVFPGFFGYSPEGDKL